MSKWRFNEDTLDDILNVVVQDANDAKKDSLSNKDDDFQHGVAFGYYCALDTIKNQLEARDVHLESISFDLMELLSQKTKE